MTGSIYGILEVRGIILYYLLLLQGLQSPGGLAGLVDVRKGFFKVSNEGAVIVEDFLRSIGLFLLVLLLVFSFDGAKLFFGCFSHVGAGVEYFLGVISKLSAREVEVVF